MPFFYSLAAPSGLRRENLASLQHIFLLLNNLSVCICVHPWFFNIHPWFFFYFQNTVENLSKVC